MTAAISRSQPVHDVLRHCKFCGNRVIAPCDDLTDLRMYADTVEVCFDAWFAFEFETYSEAQP